MAEQNTFFADFLGDENIPSRRIFGTSKEDVIEQAGTPLEAGLEPINPANLRNWNEFVSGQWTPTEPATQEQLVKEAEVREAPAEPTTPTISPENQPFVDVLSSVLNINPSEVTDKMIQSVKSNNIDRGDLTSVKQFLDETYLNSFDRKPTTAEYEHFIFTGGKILNRSDADAFRKWQQEVSSFAEFHPESISAENRLASELPPEFQSLYTKMEDYIQTLVDQGQQLNPDIEITPERLEEFAAQAREEFEPFFTGEEKTVFEGLQRALARSTQLQKQQEEDISRQFGEEFRGVGESAAERGTVFSGERLRMESELAEGVNRQIQRQREDLSFRAGTASLSAEREIGSTSLQRLQFPTLGDRPFALATGEFGTQTEPLSFGEVSGDILGTLPREQLVAEEERTAELENIFRQRQLLSTA